jgi:hypothetical protein
MESAALTTRVFKALRGKAKTAFSAGIKAGIDSAASSL